MNGRTDVVEKQTRYEVTAGKQTGPMDDHEFFNAGGVTVDDWRWGRAEQLGLFFLDRQLIERQAEQIKAQTELDDANTYLRECKKRLECREGTVQRGIDEKEIFGTVRTNKDERKEKRQYVVLADENYQSRLDTYNKAVAIRDKAQSDLAFAEDAVKNVRMRLNWRTHLLDLLTSNKPIPLDRVPDEDGNVPALQRKTTPKEGEVPTNKQTRDWLDAMVNEDVRYGIAGKLALEVLPEGVDSEYPQVKAMLDDIRRRFEAPTL